MFVEGLNPNVSHEMWLDMQAEAAVAQEMGVPWQMRGPPGDPADPHARWRGQRYRPETGKWANRGGENREYYRGYYKGVAEGTQAKAAATRFGNLDGLADKVNKMTAKGKGKEKKSGGKGYCEGFAHGASINRAPAAAGSGSSSSNKGGKGGCK